MVGQAGVFLNIHSRPKSLTGYVVYVWFYWRAWCNRILRGSRSSVKVLCNHGGGQSAGQCYMIIHWRSHIVNKGFRNGFHARNQKFMSEGVQLWQRFLLFFLLMREGGSKYHFKRVTIGPPAKRHIIGVSLAGRYWPNIECWLGTFVISGDPDQYGLATIIFAIFQGGGVRTPCPPLDPPMDSGWTDVDMHMSHHYWHHFIIQLILLWMVFLVCSIFGMWNAPF